MQPLPVELINHTSWLALWLPFVVAMLGSAVALFGVFWSNRTNRRAIDAADQRAREDRQDARDLEFRKWQRDTLLKLADQVVEAGIEAHDEYAKLASAGTLLRNEDFNKGADIIDAQGRKIAANIARMRLIGAHETADRAADLRRAINDRELLGTVVEVYAAPKNRDAAKEEGRVDRFDAEMTARRHRRDELIAAIAAARAEFGQAVERELARTNAGATQPG